LLNPICSKYILSITEFKLITIKTLVPHLTSPIPRTQQPNATTTRMVQLQAELWPLTSAQLNSRSTN
uniref:Uncharacterized protein n=1 Tax=Papio anubis TaxID=9555 RepID=A0A8I5R7J9_PAPAN